MTKNDRERLVKLADAANEARVWTRSLMATYLTRKALALSFGAAA